MDQAIRELGWKRSNIVVSIKIFWGGQGPNDKGLSRKHTVEGTKASLKRFDMDYVDDIYCHGPDTSTLIEETVRAMNNVIDKGGRFTGKQVSGQRSRSLRLGGLLSAWIWWAPLLSNMSIICCPGTRLKLSTSLYTPIMA